MIEALAKYIIALQNAVDNTTFAEDRSIYQSYLAHSGVILAKLVDHKDIAEDIADYERLLGHTWLQDKTAYNNLYALWDIFKKSCK